MIPGIIMAMGFYAIYLQLGLLQSVPGLIVADSTLAVPFAVLIFTAFMSGIPGELLQPQLIRQFGGGAGVFVATGPVGFGLADQPPAVARRQSSDRVSAAFPEGWSGGPSCP